ncbi:major facilitator superfamily domain-containing protein, partial [Leucosporidium creatinivorum]
LAVSFGMIGLVGMNDSATGANLDSMQAFYQVSYDYISLVFLANVAGYFLSCLSSSFLTHHLGLRSSLHFAALSLSSGCLILSFAPPFGAFIASIALMGFGGGLYDSAITTVISHEESGALMSYTYAFFGVGATFSPLIIGSFVDKGYPWNQYYYCPLGVSILLAILSHYAFRNSTMSVQTRMIRALKMPFVWVGFLLIILAFGMTDVLSGWMVSFQNEKRGMPDAAARYNLSGLWAGIALGRVILAYFLDDRLGEKTFSVVMLTCAAGFLGIVWAVRNYIVDAVALVLVGFFLGPVTPKVLSTVSARVPPSLKGSTMSMTIGLGLIGSAVGPLLFGVAAGKGYLASLPAVLIVCSVIAAGVWSVVPKNKRRED